MTTRPFTAESEHSVWMLRLKIAPRCGRLAGATSRFTHAVRSQMRAGTHPA